MPENITDSSAFTDPVVVPSDSDPANRSYLVTAVQGLANRTRWLKNEAARVAGYVGGSAGSDEWAYPSARARTLIFDLPSMVLGTLDDGSPMWAVKDGGVTGPNLVPLTDDGDGARAKAWCYFRLPSGATITAVRVLIAKHADLPTESDRYAARFDKLINWDFSPAAAPGRSVIGSSTHTGTGGSGGTGTLVPAVIEWTGLSEIVDAADTTYCVAVTGPATVGADDRLYGVEVTFDDPGPRNF